MPDDPYPTLEEFWRRLEARGTEPDLRAVLAARTRREQQGVQRVGDFATVVAVAGRLVPGRVPAAALAAFLDEHFDRQLGRGDERVGVLPRDSLIPAGFSALERATRDRHGRPFAELAEQQQDELLGQAEQGEIQGPEGFDSSEWFKRVLQLLLLGFGSDPRGMVQMGFPGPSYASGHVWLDRGEVAARERRRRGYLRL